MKNKIKNKQKLINTICRHDTERAAVAHIYFLFKDTMNIQLYRSKLRWFYNNSSFDVRIPLRSCII